MCANYINKHTAWIYPFQRTPFINQITCGFQLAWHQQVAPIYMSVKQPRAFQDNDAVEIDMQKQEK